MCLIVLSLSLFFVVGQFCFNCHLFHELVWDPRSEKPEVFHHDANHFMVEMTLVQS